MMPTESLNCPFCNAVIPATFANGRVTCPRCGDSFAARGGIASPSARGSELANEVQRHREARQATGSRSSRNAIIIALVLGVLGVGVGLGINYFRQKKDPPPSQDMETAKPVAPLDMPGLEYLPAGTDSVIAFQLKAFQQSIPNTGDLSDTLKKLGIPKDVLDTIERATGMGLNQLDQLVIGLKLREGVFPPQPVLVVHTSKPISIEEIAARANARSVNKKSRTYFHAAIPKSFLNVYWWSPSDRVLIAALNADHLDAIPDPPHTDLSHLSPRLVDQAKSLLTDDTTCWAVLDSEKWDTVADFIDLFSKRKGKENITGSFGVLRTATLGIRVDREPILTAWFELKSDQAATDFRTLLTERMKDEAKVSVGGAGNRVMVRLPVSAGIVETIQKAMPTKK